jgi:limonene-1,2-epoxide hydrolase
MTPRQVVEEWVRRFNTADADAMAELYRDDAINHQVVQEPVVGKAAIREMFRRDFAMAKMTCIPEIMHEAGNVAILEWTDPLGLRGCGFFKVEDNHIVFQRGYWDRLSFFKQHGLPRLTALGAACRAQSALLCRSGLSPPAGTPNYRRRAFVVSGC